ncbi:MAG: proline dehydrogenase family protein, partial [Pelagibacteraceae bacterium]
IVLQAYMLRSENDLEILSDENFNVRICKGIYVEDESIVFKNFYKIRENYISLVKKGLLNNSYIAIATHDEEIINHLSSWIIENNIPNSQFEFQSLHGVPIEKKLQELLSQSFKVRIYLPFGDNWYDYSIRRLKENPKMAGYILKNLFKKIFRI